MKVIIDRKYRWRGDGDASFKYWFAGAEESILPFVSFCRKNPGASIDDLRIALSKLRGHFAVTIKQGRYLNTEFSYLSLNFLGKPPLLALTDSHVALYDGNTYNILGDIDLKDMSNLFTRAKFISDDIRLGGWVFFSEEYGSAGVKKDVDNKFEVCFGNYRQEDDGTDAGTELRYNVRGDQYLSLRMQKENTIVGFEKRTEF